MRHLQLVLIVRDGADAAQHRMRALLAGKVDQQAIEGGYLNVAVACHAFAQHRDPLRD